MNLQAIAVGAIAAVNPCLSCTWKRSVGYNMSADGKQVPAYSTQPNPITCQIQPLSSRDLQMLDGINLQGTVRAVYISGRLDGVSRPEVTGGDLIVTPNGEVWLVTQPLEQWGKWSKAVITLQNGS